MPPPACCVTVCEVSASPTCLSCWDRLSPAQRISHDEVPDAPPGTIPCCSRLTRPPSRLPAAPVRTPWLMPGGSGVSKNNR